MRTAPAPPSATPPLPAGALSGRVSPGFSRRPLSSASGPRPALQLTCPGRFHPTSPASRRPNTCPLFADDGGPVAPVGCPVPSVIVSAAWCAQGGAVGRLTCVRECRLLTVRPGSSGGSRSQARRLFSCYLLPVCPTTLSLQFALLLSLSSLLSYSLPPVCSLTLPRPSSLISNNLPSDCSSTVSFSNFK